MNIPQHRRRRGRVIDVIYDTADNARAPEDGPPRRDACWRRTHPHGKSGKDMPREQSEYPDRLSRLNSIPALSAHGFAGRALQLLDLAVERAPSRLLVAQLTGQGCFLGFQLGVGLVERGKLLLQRWEERIESVGLVRTGSVLHRREHLQRAEQRGPRLRVGA